MAGQPLGQLLLGIPNQPKQKTGAVIRRARFVIYWLAGSP